ncbi:MAG: polyprenyl synthetase family protein [Deltaproteobacteria bacterium]|nr:polyprenyl synthetase family protein [Deltaproteobacteria bacterium]
MGGADGILKTLEVRAAGVSRVLEALLSEDRDLLGEISLYSFYGGGKRLRPVVFSLAWELLGGKTDDLVLRGASVFELVHMASLLHDDIVDSSDTRRGRRAAHLEFGIPEAVLAGDYLVAKASRLALEWRNMDVFGLLTDVLRELSYGELYQLKARRDPELSRDGYYDIIRRKTAALLSASAETPAALLSAPPESRDALRGFGERYGTAFQIADDVLDYCGEPGALGKPVLRDLDEGRVTLPLILARDTLPPAKATRLKVLARMPERTDLERAEVLDLVREGGGVESARAEAAGWAREAARVLDRFPAGPAADLLRSLALLNAERER